MVFLVLGLLIIAALLCVAAREVHRHDPGLGGAAGLLALIAVVGAFEASRVWLG